MGDKNYHEDIEIDPYNLVEEWNLQPALYMSYAEETVEEQGILDELKDKLDARVANVELEIRQGIYPLMPEGMKITDKAITALVTLDPKVQELKKMYNKQKKEVHLLRKIETAFEMRKEGLENMVILTGRKMYADPVDRTKTIENKRTKNTIDKMDKKINVKR